MADKNTENNENVETEQKKDSRIKTWFKDHAGTILPIVSTVAGGFVGALGVIAYERAKTTGAAVEPIASQRVPEVPPTETEEVSES